jgi:DNA-binding response OmpR family regulator
MSRILLIDDDDQCRGMLRQALRREGYEVVEARDGKEGLIRFRTAAIDLVITDVLMPEQEGLQTIRELRAECPAIKIIAISGGGARGTLNFLKTAVLIGAQCTLRKPFDLEELRQAISTLLNVS